MALFDSFMGVNTALQGTIHAHGSAGVESRVRGGNQAKCEVLLGKDGKVEGDITEDSVVVGSQILGDIHAQSRLEITFTSRVSGDIPATRITSTKGRAT